MILFVFCAHLLGILSAIDAAMTARTSQGAIAWAVSLATFPYLALPAYWVLGRSKFEGVAEARHENEAAIKKLIDEVTPQLQSTFAEQADRIPAYKALTSLSELGMSWPNETELLINGEATYTSILDGIAKAENYVLVEFYIVRADGIGQRLKDALIERANNGVAAYLVYDEIGTSDLPKSYIEELRQAGVEVSAFNTTQGSRNRFQLNFRNHRKIVVVDGVSAWVGGLNVGDDYLGEDPKLSPWRDTHMRIKGPAALQAQRAFVSDWYWATREIIELSWEAKPSTTGNAAMLMIASSPAQQRETATLFFTHAISSAQKRLWLTSPYFVPDEGIINALTLAAFRGVDIRIIVPGTSDNPLVKQAAYFYIEELEGTGIQFYEYGDGFMHQKVMLIDENIATVGTANFDNRSFRLNFEITALVDDREFNQEVETMLLEDMKNSQALDLEALKIQPYWRHIPRRIARLFAPVL